MMNYGVSDLTRKLASTIRGYMGQHGITQAELAAAVGISQSQLSKLVRGLRPIEIDQYVSMGLDAGMILTEAEDFLADYDVCPIAKVIYVEDGRVLPEPHVISEVESAPLVSPLRKRASNVIPLRQTEEAVDLLTVDLSNEPKAATQDDGGTPEYPNG